MEKIREKIGKIKYSSKVSFVVGISNGYYQNGRSVWPLAAIAGKKKSGVLSAAGCKHIILTTLIVFHKSIL